MPVKRAPSTPRMAITQVALVTGTVVLFFWDLSLLLGLPGLAAALPVLLRSRRAGLGREHRPAWLGLYGAVVGSVCALAIHIALGEFTRESLLEFLSRSPVLKGEGEGPPGRGAGLIEVWKLMPVYCLAGNAFGGALGGALAGRFTRRREG